jgi:hypothetical protein
VISTCSSLDSEPEEIAAMPWETASPKTSRATETRTISMIHLLGDLIPGNLSAGDSDRLPGLEYSKTGLPWLGPARRQVKLLDTSVAIDHLRGSLPAVNHLTDLLEAEESIFASEVVRFELLAGVREREVDALEQFFFPMITGLAPGARLLSRLRTGSEACACSGATV